jgi:5-methylcytosine-specific restriction endonuclease McrA
MTQQANSSSDISRITDHELIVSLRRLVCADHKLSARLLEHLGEVDARGLYREYAYASMFAYCVEELHMSEAEAYLRIHAARLGRQFPLIVQLFAQGSLHLTAIKLLGPHLTPDNHVHVLARASGKGKREIELLVAALAPKPDVESRMRKLPEPGAAHAARVEAPLAPSLVRATPAPTSNVQPAQAPCAPEEHVATPSIRAALTPFALEAPRQRASSAPLSPGRYKVELTAGQALHDKLEQLKQLLRHQVPDGDLARIVELAVDLLVDKTMKQRFAQTRAPKQPRSNKSVVRRRKLNSRYIPRAVVREVYERDAGQCTFVSSDGRRCSERGFLEFHHHDVPYAKGGEATVANVRLACRVHNALFAERDFGRTFMRSKLLHSRERTDQTSELVPELRHADDPGLGGMPALCDQGQRARGQLSSDGTARDCPT